MSNIPCRRDSCNISNCYLTDEIPQFIVSCNLGCRIIANFVKPGKRNKED